MPTKVKFDVHNQQHLDQYLNFVQFGKWIQPCFFELEEDYSCIPTMIRDKIVTHVLMNRG